MIVIFFFGLTTLASATPEASVGVTSIGRSIVSLSIPKIFRPYNAFALHDYSFDSYTSGDIKIVDQFGISTNYGTNARTYHLRAQGEGKDGSFILRSADGQTIPYKVFYQSHLDGYQKPKFLQPSNMLFSQSGLQRLNSLQKTPAASLGVHIDEIHLQSHRSQPYHGVLSLVFLPE